MTTYSGKRTQTFTNCGRGLSAREPVLVHHGRRIDPEIAVHPTSAWAESEHSAGSVQAKLLGVIIHDVRKELDLNTKKSFEIKPKVITQWEKRKSYILNALRPPPFVTAMVALMIMMHIMFPKREQTLALEWSPGPWWRQPWRALTYGAVHSGAAHLALNAFMAFVVGWSMEREQRWWRVGGVWAGGLAAGALGAGVLQPTMYMVGASAAVFALLTSHVPNVCLRYGNIRLVWFRLLSVCVLCASEMLYHVTCYERTVAWSSHLVGAVAGILIGFLLYTGENNGKVGVTICRSLCSCLLVAALVATALCYWLRHGERGRVPHTQLSHNHWLLNR